MHLHRGSAEIDNETEVLQEGRGGLAARIAMVEFLKDLGPLEGLAEEGSVEEGGSHEIWRCREPGPAIDLVIELTMGGAGLEGHIYGKMTRAAVKGSVPAPQRCAFLIKEAKKTNKHPTLGTGGGRGNSQQSVEQSDLCSDAATGIVPLLVTFQTCTPTWQQHKDGQSERRAAPCGGSPPSLPPRS